MTRWWPCDTATIHYFVASLTGQTEQTEMAGSQLAAPSLQDSQDPFAEIREAANADDGSAQQLLVVLAALRETIGECRTTPTARAGQASADPSATEYLAAILSALQGSDQSHTPQLLALMAAAMPCAHRSLLRLKFPAIAAVIMALLKENGLEGEDSAAGSSANVLQRLLRCTGHLLAAQESTSAVWSSPGVLRAFQSLLHFFADHRSKVRRAAHEAVVTILAAQGSSGSRGGSGGGPSKRTSNKGPAAHTIEFCRAVVTSCTSQDVTRALHLLQFMRLGVPLFPPKQAASLCGLSLRLLPLGSPPLTAAVMQMLSAVVQSPRSCLPAPLLAKLTEELLTLQPSRSAGAGAVSFAPLLASCVVRLQGIDSEASGKLLARAVLALIGYCESSSTAVHKSSCGALNLMFQACVDQDMVTQMAGSLGRGHAAVGALADTLSALEALLQYRFQKSWPQSLPLLGRLFLHLRGASYPLLVSVLRGLGELHDALTSVPSAALPGVTSALNEAVSFAIEGMGAERVLGVLPLAPTGATPVAEGGLAEARAWLLPLLTQHTGATPSRLAFFQSYVLTTAKACDGAAKSGRLTANEARTQRFRVVQLWGLLPGFCARPTDVAGAFGNLAPILANAMQDTNYTGILPIVCAGLQALVTGVKARCGTEVGGGDTAAKADLEKLSNTATRFLPKLFALIDPAGGEVTTVGVTVGSDAAAAVTAANERTAAVCGAAAALASVAPQAFLSSLFKKLLQKLIESTTVGGAGGAGTDGLEDKADLKRAQVLLQLASGLTPSLDQEAISLLYRSTKPLVLDDGSPQVQKRAYKVLLALCTHQADFMSSPENLPHVLELFTSSLLTCHVSARVMRLQCLSRVAASFTPGNAAQAQFLPAATLEVVLCTKDSNGRTRELAYNVLVLFAVARGNPADAVRTVVSGLAASTPHARSAAVLALGRLQLEFGHFRSERWDARVADMVPELTATMLLLLKEPSREVVKAVLGWLRVAVGGADREVLRPMIADIVTGVMSGTTPRHKDHFRAKIRIVLSKLCRKFGFEEIKALMPEHDKKLVAHMQTTAERELKAKKTRLIGGRAGGDNGARGGGGGGGDEGKGGITKAVRTFDAIMEGSDAGDSDSEDEFPNNGRASGGARRGRASGADMMVRERGEDGTSVVDLLDASMVRNMRVASGKRGGNKKSCSGSGFFGSDDSGSDDSGSDEGPELGLRDGKFVIPGGSDDDDSDEDDGEGRRKKKRSRGNGDDSDDDDRDNYVVDTGKNETGFAHIPGRKTRAAADEGSSQGAMGRAVPGGRGAGRGGAGAGAGRGGGAAGKRQKVGMVRGTATGAEFRSKKAGGDVKRKGATLEPYAYIPLDGRTLTGKKAGNTALEQYGAVVGAVRGKKAHQQRKRGK